MCGGWWVVGGGGQGAADYRFLSPVQQLEVKQPVVWWGKLPSGQPPSKRVLYSVHGELHSMCVGQRGGRVVYVTSSCFQSCVVTAVSNICRELATIFLRDNATIFKKLATTRQATIFGFATMSRKLSRAPSSDVYHIIRYASVNKSPPLVISLNNAFQRQREMSQSMYSLSVM